MITIQIETEKGTKIEIPLQEAEQIYLALKSLFEKSDMPYKEVVDDERSSNQ